MLKAIEKALLFQEFDLLRFVSADHLMQLAEICQEEAFKAGDTLFQQGEPAGKLYFLVSGRARFEASERQFVRNTVLNIWPCLAGAGHPATCRCVEDCTALTVAAEDLLDLLGSEPELSLALLKHCAWTLLADTK
jgi:CRP-like cAMP-binding protein